MAFTLVSRAAVAAPDGAPVVTPEPLLLPPNMYELAVATFLVSVTGAPATYNARAAIEMSPDGGTTWHQVVRFKDITNAQTKSQVVRAGANSAISAADIVASDLTVAAAAAVMIDTPWGVHLRGVSMLQGLASGTATLVVILELANS